MKTNKSLSLVAGSVAVIALYMGARMAIYHFMPVASVWAWYIRDTVMSLPRIAGFVSLLLLNRYVWKVVPFDFRLRKYRKPMIFCVVLLIIHSIYWLGCSGSSYPLTIAVGAFFTTVFVGLFEEYAFRGALLSGLTGLMSPFKAIVLSNLVFAVYHVQAQPVSDWISIFLIGSILACMRIRGISLFWLAVIHIVIDDLDFFIGLNRPPLLSSNYMLFNIGLLVFAIYLFSKRNANRLIAKT